MAVGDVINVQMAAANTFQPSAGVETELIIVKIIIHIVLV